MKQVTHVLQERSEYGDFKDQGAWANQMKKKLRQGPNYDNLLPHQKESLDMIVTKISRLVFGSDKDDHWIDISGYADLGRKK